MVQDFFANNIRWLVPFTLLLLQILMKVLIGGSGKNGEMWKAILQTPVQTGFLALSFAATVLLSAPQHAASVFGICLVYIVVLIFSILIWKAAPTTLTKKDVLKAAGLTILNFVITLPMLVFSIIMLLDIHGNSG